MEATESDDEANGEVSEKLLEENLDLQEEDSDPDSDLVFINCSGTAVYHHCIVVYNSHVSVDFYCRVQFLNI